VAEQGCGVGAAPRKYGLFPTRAGQSRLDYFEKVPGIEGFIENINGAFVDGFLSNFRIVVRRYQDDGQLRTFQPDATL
jgi:hypothetical protein